MNIQLPKAVDEDLAADLEKQSVYVSPSVRGLRVNAARDAVEVDFSDDKDPDAKAKVERYIETMVSRFRKLPKKIFAENKRRDSAPYGRNRITVASADCRHHRPAYYWRSIGRYEIQLLVF